MSSRIEALKNALKKDPDNPLGLYGLAVELFKEKRYQEAVEYLLRYLEKHEDQGAAYRLLAQAYTELGKIDEAVQAYEKGIEQAEKFKHSSMVKEFSLEIESLKKQLT
ncbi:tetratricopeptide repeat protein [Persephonella sp.]